MFVPCALPQEMLRRTAGFSTPCCATMVAALFYALALLNLSQKPCVALQKFH